MSEINIFNRINCNKELMKVFKDESQSEIGAMRKGLHLLEKELNEEKKHHLIKELFRYAHTLRSSSGTVGFTSLAELARALGEVFKAARGGKLEIKASIISLLNEGVSACEVLLEKKKVLDYKDLVKRLGKLINQKRQK